ncbi:MULTISPECIES: sulfurtransferase [Halomonadaceae]|uniref:Sulfurtransferase n=2 Tax=Vreelandella TaxID=3137766 RepID=A0A7Z0LT90_9GAMM|nr:MULTISPECIES: sulfurtransferase [Halomonas]AJY49715.1 Rhodanese-like protein [Halomonas sp. KO116]NYS78158.1 sulfurtransferase [Halomonas glaciei]|tara:strand:- start:1228 stop:2199 length:972 start_codon:yes stop_codon:yes gene_type:complete
MSRLLLGLVGAVGFSAQALALEEMPLEITPLVDAQWLNEHLDQEELVVVDVRSSIDEGGDAESFAEARIPGSRYSSYTDDGWRETRDSVAGLMPEVSDLETLIGDLGIDNDSAVVIVPAGTGATDFGSAARVYWTLKVLGHEDVAILNGGFAGWEQQGFDVASGEPESYDAAEFDATLREELIASTEDVEAARESQAQLVDARPADYFSGDNQSPAARVAGTIPGARSLPHQSHLNDQNGAYYLDVDGLQSRINAVELDSNERTIAFCNTGHWAATDWFVLSEVAEFDNIAMYDGSMAAWTISDSRPVQLAREGIKQVKELLN